MKERRRFLKTVMAIVAGAGGLSVSFLLTNCSFRGEEKNIVPQKKMSRESPAHSDPVRVNPRDLEITPLRDFQTMGETIYKFDPEKWRLEIKGRIKRPLVLTHSEIHTLPSTERAYRLICPGFFTNHGFWKGIRMDELLQRVEPEGSATEVIFASGEGGRERTEKFPLQEVWRQKVFLAYGVNGEPLPEKHGFPLRVVAEGHYGARWIKYVNAVEVG